MKQTYDCVYYEFYNLVTGENYGARRYSERAALKNAERISGNSGGDEIRVMRVSEDREIVDDVSVLHREKMSALEKAASDLFDNRLGWSCGRAPYAPRVLWRRLGAVLYGTDDPRVVDLGSDECK